MFTFSTKLEKWSFHVADFPRRGKKCTERKRHVKGVQSFCFASLNMQNLLRYRCRRVVDLKLSVVATRCSDGEGKAGDLLKNQVKRGIVRISGTVDKEGSWWRVDLTEKYTLYLTHYTAYQYASTRLA